MNPPEETQSAQAPQDDAQSPSEDHRASDEHRASDDQSPRAETTTSETTSDAARKPSAHALKIMAAVRWVLLALVTLLAGYTVLTFLGPKSAGHTEHAVDKYYCPMHPEIRSSEPGECPICHMTLEPIPEERKAQRPKSGPAAKEEAPANVTAVSLSAEKQKAIGLRTSVVESATLGERLRVPGVVSAPETGISQVRVRAPGFVEQVAVRQTGVRVSAGQPLAFIYSPEIYRAQEEYLAAIGWQVPGAAPDPGLPDLTQAARRGLELLGLSQKDIEEITQTKKPIRAIAVRAPASGYITRFGAILGSRADPETVLYEIADLSKVWVLASVHERDLKLMSTGMGARFSATGGKEPPIEGTIDLIEPLLDEATRTTRVRIVIANKETTLRPGQFGQVEFELPAAPGLFVPRDAIIRTGESEYVYVAEASGHFVPRLVEMGITRGDKVEVRKGLREGERVVTRGSFLLDSESRLKASLASAPAAQSEER
jgi:Cu(I)/Ag(I) efflux system membrane fusion protein